MSSITNNPTDFSVMFLDMNSFFASVEQQVQPTLRGLPVGVAPYTGNTGCIIAASIEAKRMGIKIGLVGEAKKLCPEIKIIEARPALYMLYHKEIKKVIESFTPYYQPLSIDEFAIYLTRQDQSFDKSKQLALNLKQAIAERVGDYLKCSIGVGPSVFLAKMAGERQKPDGLTILELKNLEQFYSELKLTDLTGINWRMELQLKKFNIHSPLQFYNLPLGEQVAMLKHLGRLWYYRLRGYEVDSTGSTSSLQAGSPQVDDYIVKNKTIGHSCVLSPEFRSKEGAMSVLRKLIFKAGYRLRKEKYLAQGVSVAINFMDKTGFHLSRKFSPFADNATFLTNTYQLLSSCQWRGRPILVAVSSFNLRPAGDCQISIFGEVERSRKISQTLDKINDEFGAETIVPASVLSGKDAAPDRIPFGRPRYEIMH